MRRLPLSAKLFAAVLPLLLALAALLTITVRDGFRQVDEARLGARLGSTWEPLIQTMRVIETEQVTSRSDDRAAIVDARRATNGQMVLMNAALAEIPGAQPLVIQLGETLTALGLAREAVDNPALGEARGRSAGDSYDVAEANLVTVGRLLASEAGNTQLARDLTAVAALAEVEQRSRSLAGWIRLNVGSTPEQVSVDRALRTADEVATASALFRAVASPERIDEVRDTGLQRTLGDTRRAIEGLRDPAGSSQIGAGVLDAIDAPVAEVADLRDALALEVVAESNDRANSIALRTWLRAAAIIVAALAAAALALFLTRSITRRVREVSHAAHEVSTERLPALVEALHDPRGQALPAVTPIDARGSDELAELAGSFNALQEALAQVAREQIEVLRRGVSDIFVTMARRNRSLVDRQLTLLDELEASVTDADVLANYYRLDHLATRMRRNSESLLVLAAEETTRRRVPTTPIDDVVRAAVGEVEDYRRVDILTLEPVSVRGAHVADVAHLLAELLDNATSFSAPETRVRVEGAVGGDGTHYRVTIRDEGMGMERAKLNDLNDLLSSPPVVGLSVEPTLGMSVVSLLAAKHGLQVRLGRPGADEYGIVAEIMIPAAVLDGELPGHAVPASGTVDGAALRLPSATGVAETTPASGLVLDVDDRLELVDANDGGPAADDTPTGLAIDPFDTGALFGTDAGGPVDAEGDGPSIEEIVAALDGAGRYGGAEEHIEEHIEEHVEGDAAPVAERDPAHPAGAPDRSSLRLEIPADLLAGFGNAAETADAPAPVADAEPAVADAPAPVADAEPAVADAPAPVADAEPAVASSGFAPPAGAGPVSTLPPPSSAGAAPPAAPADRPALPTRSRSELDRPPAPPVFSDRPLARPVVPDSARPLPTRTRPDRDGPRIEPSTPSTSTGTTTSGLPVRSRAEAADHTDGARSTGSGPRVPDQPENSSTAATSAPSALGAALAAFEAGRRGNTRTTDDDHWEDPR